MIIFVPILSSLIHITPPENIIDIKIIFLIEIPIGIMDQRPSKAVVEKQPAEWQNIKKCYLLLGIFFSRNLISQKTYRCFNDCISAISFGTSPLKLLLLKSSISNITRALNSLGIGPLNKLLESTLHVGNRLVKALTWV